MGKKEAEELPAPPSIFDRLEGLRPLLAAETVEGVHDDRVRLALTNVVGALDHVVSAVHQANPLWRRG